MNQYLNISPLVRGVFYVIDIKYLPIVSERFQGNCY